jgi:uncharacterized membrane protein (DUF485 family)
VHPENPSLPTQPVSAKPTHKYAPARLEQTLFLLLTCVGLGVIADSLFRTNFLGLNVSLFVTALVTSLYVWSRRFKGESFSPLLLGGLLILTWLFSWRDSLFLQFLNLAVQFFLLLLVAARLSGSFLFKTNFAEMALNLLRTGFALVISGFAFLLESPWKDLSKFRERGHGAVALSVLRGVVIALPLVVVFAVLLSSADARFETLVNQIFRVDVETMLGHLFTIAFVSFMALALFAQHLFGKPWKEADIQAPKLLSLGVIETGLICGSLVVLFSSFIALQFGYLFGGEERVLTSDVTFAQYGRRGFFELVTVTVLLHVVLLVGLWLTSKEKAKQLYRPLASVLVILLYGIIWSAFSRLGIYIEAYGLTELRYYSSSMTLWIGVVMLYFLFRLHSNGAPKLAPSYLALGILGVVALYFSNPDAQIAKFNLERSQTSANVDVAYLENLSLDATPVMTDFARNQSATPEAFLLSYLLNDTYQELPEADWRSFNLGRWQGARALDEFINEATLQTKPRDSR